MKYTIPTSDLESASNLEYYRHLKLVIIFCLKKKNFLRPFPLVSFVNQPKNKFYKLLKPNNLIKKKLALSNAQKNCTTLSICVFEDRNISLLDLTFKLCFSTGEYFFA